LQFQSTPVSTDILNIRFYINQSIGQNLYSAPSRYLLRGAPDPGQAERNRAITTAPQKSLERNRLKINSQTS